MSGAPTAPAAAEADAAGEPPQPAGRRPRLFGSLSGTERRLAIAIGAIALVGVGIATYLVYVHYAGIQPFCVSGGGGCEKVQTSDFAKLAGIPVADLGLAGYLAILASLFVRGDLGRLAGAAIALSGFGFSLYLTYREIFTIKAICQWCVASAVLMTLLAILTVLRLLKSEPDPVA
ncbi:MAG: hypothetical protein QOC77_3495 [Thermoleophilaceae bacterium]|nr:hypothetical protein [Thermoleophilaceae bacterium]MEA2471122.1 hypothetical protein [Thermoleophilaceae bacterium]